MAALSGASTYCPVCVLVAACANPEFHAGTRLAIALPRPAKVNWGHGGWRSAADEPTQDSGLGFHVAALDVSRVPPGQRIEFTWQWQESGAWHRRDYQVVAISADET